MLDELQNELNEFMNLNLPTWWVFFLIILFLIFAVTAFNYLSVYKSPLMKKVLFTHGFIDRKEYSNDESHFHNSDTVKGFFNIKRDTPETASDWIGKHFLFIPSDKINTIKKKDWRKMTIWYNGHSSQGIDYRVKKIHKDWREQKLTKKNISNYNGTFIISNLMVKTLNLTSLRIDAREERKVTLTYLFDNGSKQVQKISRSEFIGDMIHKTIPYNLVFLKYCEIIELR